MVTYFLFSSDELNKTNFSLFPNPANDKLRLVSGEVKINNVTIYSLTGAKILGPVVDSSQIIDVSQLTSGIYFVQIEHDHGQEIHKIMKD